MYEPMTSLSVFSKTLAHGVSEAKGQYVALPVSPRYLVQSIDHDYGSGETSFVTHFMLVLLCTRELGICSDH